MEPIRIIVAESGLVPMMPNWTFMPRNDDTIVGIDRTIVIPARNFIISFWLLLITEL